MYRIFRVENGKKRYVGENGYFVSEEKARLFDDKEYAEQYLETEKSDPIYDKAFMDDVTEFGIEEV